MSPVLGLTPVILDTWEAEIRRVLIQGQLRQRKVPRTPCQWEKAGPAGTCLSSQQAWKNEIQASWSGYSGQKVRPYFQNGWRCGSRDCEVWSSNPSTTKINQSIDQSHVRLGRDSSLRLAPGKSLRPFPKNY
jgi:hypothetical protein